MSTYETLVCDRCGSEARRPAEKPFVPEGWMDIRIEHSYSVYASMRLIYCMTCVDQETIAEALARDR